MPHSLIYSHLTYFSLYIFHACLQSLKNLPLLWDSKYQRTWHLEKGLTIFHKYSPVFQQKNWVVWQMHSYFEHSSQNSDIPKLFGFLNEIPLCPWSLRLPFCRCRTISVNKKSRIFKFFLWQFVNRGGKVPQYQITSANKIILVIIANKCLLNTGQRPMILCFHSSPHNIRKVGDQEPLKW